MHSDTLTADVTADDMAILELLTFSMAGAGDATEARREARLGAWARSAVPAGSQGRAMLMHLRLVEAGKYLTVRRKRMPHPEATRDTRVTRPCNRAKEIEARAMARNAVHWAGEAGLRCEAEKERADWAARSRCTDNPDENTFRSGREWASRPAAQARDRESGDGGECWKQPKRARRAAAPAAVPQIPLDNAFEPLQDLQEDHASESGESVYWSAQESLYESTHESMEESAYETDHEDMQSESEYESEYESAYESGHAIEDHHAETWARRRPSESESENDTADMESEEDSESGGDGKGEGGSAELGDLVVMLSTMDIEDQQELPTGSRPAKRSVEMNGEEQEQRKGARRVGPEDADEAVRTGRCRHAGWNADGSERLARIWQIEEKVLRPRVTKRKTPEVLSRATFTRRKRWDEVQTNSTGGG